MIPFEMAEPGSLEEALALLDPEDTSVRPVAGGTALMLMMKTRLFQPSRLVRSAPAERSAVRNPDWRRGRVADRGDDAAVRVGNVAAGGRAVPVVSRSLLRLANVRIRNVATVGGHLAHGDPHMDLPPVLAALAARVTITGPNGARTPARRALHRLLRDRPRAERTYHRGDGAAAWRTQSRLCEDHRTVSRRLARARHRRVIHAQGWRCS